MKINKIFMAFLMPLLLLSGCSNTNENAEITTTQTAETTAITESETEITEITQRKVYEVDTTKKLIALTFDDGPNLTTTVEMLDVLEKHDIPASFFLIGNNISVASTEVVKRAYEMGCDIQNHSKSHSDFTKLTPEKMLEEINYTSDKIEEIVGVRPIYFRPPYISVNNEMFQTIELPFISGIGANDWEDSVSAEERYERIVSKASDGAIILLHDSQGNSKTVEAIDMIIPELISQGYQFVTISELFEAKGINGMDNQYVYSNVLQTSMY